MNTRATPFSDTYASISRALRCFTSINTIKGTYNATSHGARAATVFLPARRQ